MTPRSVVLLGSTGSVGTQAVDVINAHRDSFDVVGLSAAGRSPELLARQAAELGVRQVAVADPTAAPTVQAAVRAAGSAAEVVAGPASAEELAATGADVVLNAITGSVGLGPTLAALRAGSTLALANKESLVVGGPLVSAAMLRADQIVPVDSEHSAIAQALRAGRHEPGASEVRRLVLTASGGPFRGRGRAQLAGVTVEQAMAHPTWAMGPVVTINSATMVNKGLELIEAHLLFGVPVADIVVVVHPQSYVHSMVEFVDGSTIANASPPDMRLPIALGLSWPARLEAVAPACDWSVASGWTFEPLDEETFPAVRLARQAAAASPTHPAVYNAANEECVAAFRAGRIGFLDIVDTVAAVLDDYDPRAVAGTGLDLDAVMAADAWARTTAVRMVSAA